MADAAQGEAKMCLIVRIELDRLEGMEEHQSRVPGRGVCLLSGIPTDPIPSSTYTEDADWYTHSASVGCMGAPSGLSSPSSIAPDIIAFAVLVILLSDWCT